MFDDDNVHPVHKDDILKLSGGGKLKFLNLLNLNFCGIVKGSLAMTSWGGHFFSVNFNDFLPRIIVGKALWLSF